jgi:hypothetical protein
MFKNMLNLMMTGITECDLFSASISVRYRKDDNFKTLTSGCLSISIIVMLGAFFVTSFISFINKDYMDLSELTFQAEDPTEFTISTD